MIYLFFADLIWSLAAWYVDFPKLFDIPAVFWPFIVICPIYPLILAFIWLQILKKKNLNQVLLAFAVLPSAVFGVLSLFYYPTKMYFQGFSINDLGQIFWVLFYSVQGWYLMWHFKIKLFYAFLSLIFLIFIFVIHLKYKSFGYLSYDNFSPLSLFLLFALALVSSLCVFYLTRHKSKL